MTLRAAAFVHRHLPQPIQIERPHVVFLITASWPGLLEGTLRYDADIDTSADLVTSWEVRPQSRFNFRMILFRNGRR